MKDGILTNNVITADAPLHVLIVGGGIAGLTLSILLKRKGHRVEVIEKSAVWKPAGGGITLTLNGVRILSEMGLLPEIEKKSLVIKNINIADHYGRILSSFNVGKYAQAYAKTITIARSDLHNILMEETAAPVYFNRNFISIENVGDKVKVRFNNDRLDYYDLVVASDGIYSSVREKLFPRSKIKYSGYACWRFVVNNIEDIDPSIITEMWGKGKRFGIVPLPGNKVHCFASINAPAGHKNFQNITLRKFKYLFKDFHWYTPGLINELANEDQLMYNDLEDIYMSDWQNGRVILIGDAAHGMTPNMTQGASMAIEDAFVLSQKLCSASLLDESLKEFCLQRRKRLRVIQRRSNLLGKIGQMKIGMLAGFRNYCWKLIPDTWIQNDFEKLLLTDQLYR